LLDFGGSLVFPLNKYTLTIDAAPNALDAEAFLATMMTAAARQRDSAARMMLVRSYR
jgi:hypothetical protein